MNLRLGCDGGKINLWTKDMFLGSFVEKMHLHL